MRLKKLIKGIEKLEVGSGSPRPSPRSGKWEVRYGDSEIEGIAYDSRAVKPNYIFVARCPDSPCLPTRQVGIEDSHKYINDAIKRGAKFFILEHSVGKLPCPSIIVKDSRKVLATLASNFYGNPSKKLKLIGVTGTYGKTTSTYLLKSIYEASGSLTGLLGTIKYEVESEKWEVGSAHHTTPESLELEQLFSEMLKKGVKVVILEVSSHSLVLSRVYGVDFNIACFTRLGRDHLDFHHTLKEYEKAKLKLFLDLKKDRTAILNKDDVTFKHFKEHTKANIITYGTTPSCDVQGELYSSSLKGLEIIIRVKQKTKSKKQMVGKIYSPLIGSHNFYNILLAATCALNDRIDFETVCEGIEELKQVPGRFEIIERARMPRQSVGQVIIDYAHTPDSLKSALLSVRKLTHGRLICIFGCGGDRDSGKRPLMGKVASELSDYVILTSDNPRSEDPLKIIHDIEQGAAGGNYSIVPDRREAIKKGIERSSSEDTILLAGKGHEKYQIYGELKIPWDERKIVKEILEV
ncbi:UDP-N-acetylmuramoyl-L-alanyl-D-glutamate--2,6-diaminopimelate ligase [candidate division WOR-3 bacterium]|nr:UDP-N-acetylmuramoyl-L-alanyl-D-glutamate--2,6-diaminopimelate ligase [candidate division WOR-3 bacterium]